jgi:ATP-binding cassette subfamily G (WHITE) protein 1
VQAPFLLLPLLLSRPSPNPNLAAQHTPACRVTIGMELVIDPSILVLDEPTSGLDSYTADNLMHSLKTVASAGRVVVASLHQPSRDVFMSLDQVVLMGHGRMLYMGPPAAGARAGSQWWWWLREWAARAGEETMEGAMPCLAILLPAYAPILTPSPVPCLPPYLSPCSRVLVRAARLALPRGHRHCGAHVTDRLGCSRHPPPADGAGPGGAARGAAQRRQRAAHAPPSSSLPFPPRQQQRRGGSRRQGVTPGHVATRLWPGWPVWAALDSSRQRPHGRAWWQPRGSWLHPSQQHAGHRVQ